MNFREWFYTEEMINRLDKLMKVGLSRGEMQMIATKSKGMIGIYDMIDMVKADPKRFASSVYLGLSSYQTKVTELLRLLTGMTKWHYAYKKLDVPMENGNTEEFLSKLTVSGAEVVFLLPDNLENGVTRNEFDWLKNHPETLGNVLFVVGAYDFFQSGEYEREFRKGYAQGDARQQKMANIAMFDAVGLHRIVKQWADYAAKNIPGKVARYSVNKPPVQKLVQSGAIRLDPFPGEEDIFWKVTVLDRQAVADAAEDLRQQGIRAKEDMESSGTDHLKDYIKNYRQHGGGHPDSPNWASSLV